MASAKFDPDEFLKKTEHLEQKPAFDPDRFIAETEHLEPKDNSFDASASFEGGKNSALFGYLPQVEGGIKTVANVVSGEPEQKSYVDYRDEVVQRLADAEKRSPVSYNVGSLAGSLLIPGLALAKAGKAVKSAGALANMAKAAGYGAAVGGLENPGDVKGEMGLQLDERLQGAKVGAALGGAGIVGGKVLEKAGSAIASAGKDLMTRSNLKAFSALGPLKQFTRRNANRTYMDEGEKKVFAEKIGKHLKEAGIVKPGDTFDDIAIATERLKDQTGKEIGQIYKTVTDQVKNPEVMSQLPQDVAEKVYATTFKPKQWAKELKTELAEKYNGRAGYSDGVSLAEKMIDDIAKLGDQSDLLALQRAKVDVQNRINYDTLNSLNKKPPPWMEVVEDVRSDLSDRIEKHIKALDDAFGSKNIQQLKNANDRYSALAEANTIVKDRLASESANRTFGLIDTGLAAPSLVGAANDFSQGNFEGGTKKLALAGATAVASRTARRYGNPVLSSGYAIASKLAGVPGQPVGQAMMKAGEVLVNNPMLTAVLTNELERDQNIGYLDRLNDQDAQLNSNVQKAMAKTKEGELAAIAGIVNYGSNQFGSMGHSSQLVKDYGEKDARRIMSELGNIKGVPTKDKIENLPLPNEVKARLVNDLSRTAMSEASGRKITVTPELMKDIRQSKLSPIEKAKALNSFNQTGQVTDHIIAKTLSGVKSVEPVVVPPGSSPRALAEKKARLGRE